MAPTPMANRYLLPDLPPAGRAVLQGDLAHHLGRVARARPGERIRLGDGRGHSADAEVVAVDRQSVTLEVTAAIAEAPLVPRVTLAFACPRQSRADWLIEHATEVGVAVLQPVWTERSRPQGLRLDRWRKIAAAAAGQCDRSWLPEVAEPVECAAWLTSPGLPARRLLADARGTPLDAGDRTDVVILVGPEGGLTEGEQQAARSVGFAAVRFAAHTLRTETAALVGAAMLLAAAGQLS